MPRRNDPPRSRCDSWRAHAEMHLESGLRAAGWKLSRPRGPGAPDLVAERGDVALAVELRSAEGRARRALLRGLLADALLQASTKGRALAARPLAVIASPALSDEMVAELDAYVSAFGEGAAWGAVDGRGRWSFFGPEMADLCPPKRSEFDQPASGIASEQPLANPFSDLGQWVLKVLLAAQVPHLAAHLPAPTAPIHGVSELAARASVSISSASKFLVALEREGFLERSRRGLKLVQLQSLLESWRAASRKRCEELEVRWLLPAKEPLARLEDVLVGRSSRGSPASPAGPAGGRACLGLFAACAAQGIGHVRGAPLHVYVEAFSNELLDELGVHPVEHGRAGDIVLRRASFPEAVFRGCVQGQRGGPAADLLQCWIDLASHPVRGEEQAEELANHLRLGDLEA